jgi:ribosomal-protein-alanine N-acetyltransferase
MTKILETKRLICRAMNFEDYSDHVLLDTSPEVRRFFPGGILTSEQVKQKMIHNIQRVAMVGFGDFVVTNKEGVFMGRAGFGIDKNQEVELGYKFLPKFWEKGYATEIAFALKEWGFENIPVDFMPQNRILGFAHAEHIASQKVLEKIGMTCFKIDQYCGTIFKFYEAKSPSLFMKQ